MLFYISKLIWYFLNPLNLIFIFCILAFVFYLLKFKILSKIFIFFSLIFFVITAILPTGLYLLVKLESKHPVVHSLPNQIDGILILGGPSNPILTKHYNQVTFNSHGERLTESIKLIKNYKSAKIIFSGGSGSDKPDKLTHAYVAEKFFTEMGIEKNRIIYESKSKNTYENILYSKEIAKPKKTERWLLITSAFHMPRAINIANKQSWNFLPYPVDFQTRADVIKFNLSFVNLLSYLSTFNLSSHEWVGLISYYLLGRTDRIF